MSVIAELRKCIRCKEEKPNNRENFKKQLSKIGLSRSIDKMCRKCRDKTYVDAKNARMKEQRKGIKIVCQNRNCEKEIKKLGYTKYCGDDCRKDEMAYRTKKKKREISEMDENKEINPMFLVRGRISGIYY